MKPSMKSAQAGFTLIELIVVIVILGILAATALPKLSNLSGDAQRAKLKTAFSALNSEVALIHGKVMANSSSYSAAGNGSVAVEGITVGLTSATSYPAPSTNLANAAGLTAADYDVTVDTNSSPNTMSISPKGVADKTKCMIGFVAAIPPVGVTPASAPVVSLIDTDCN